MKALFYLLLVSFVALASCTKVLHINATPNSYSMNESYTQDSAIQAMIAPYKKQLDAQMNRIIGTCAKDLVKEKPESTLGNWMSDALLIKANEYVDEPIDISLVNYGGVRIPSLPKGDITKGKIFELMPFDNVMVVVALDGVTLQVLFDHMAKKGGWPISKGVQYTIEDGKAKNVLIQNKKIEVGQTYRILLSDYIANGGDQCNFLKEQPREQLGVFIRDALISYVEDVTKSKQLLDADIDGRVSQK